MKHFALFLSLATFTVLLPWRVTASVPDSLLVQYQKLNDITQEAKLLSANTQTPKDLKHNSPRILVLKKQMENLEQRTPELFENNDMIKLYKMYTEYMTRIEENVERYKEILLIDSLHITLCKWSPRFDSLLNVGRQYVSHKAADSVRSVKRYADDWWIQIYNLHESNRSYFDYDKQLKTEYEKIDKTRSEIRDLVEKEKPKFREILMLVAVVIGVVTMVVSIVASRIKSRKMSNETYFQI